MKLFLFFYFFIIIPAVHVYCQKNDRKQYTIEQACSDRAQLHTISFNGLAFMSGNFGADCFFPPGKLADFFGFQYMRDNDKNEMGHNTDFLTNIAHNVLSILTQDQKNQLVLLAQEQEKEYDAFAYKRILLIRAFREELERDQKQISKHLNKDSVVAYCEELYRMDGYLSYERALVMSRIIRSLSQQQKAQFNLLAFDHSDTWTPKPENFDKHSISHRAHVCLMTYASELFSWYKGSLTADIYFCPERHGTYFGGFYMKDFPAMNNHGYNISTSLTGNSGKQFLEILNPMQRKKIEVLPDLQKKYLDSIVQIRTDMCTQLRQMLLGAAIDLTRFLNQAASYGRQDGSMSFLYAMAFSDIFKSLTSAQKSQMTLLRNQDVLPQGLYLFSDPISTADFNQYFKGNLDVNRFFGY